MDTTQTFYRTGKGGHRHLDFECANQRRAISTGDPIALTTAEVAEWPPCEFCCDDADLNMAAQAAYDAKAAVIWCTNPGVEQPRQYRSKCTACKQGGQVMRNGKLKSHKVR